MIWLKYRAPGYNFPSGFAMFLSQWAHQLFLWEHITYDEYIMLQNLAYRLFAN